MKPCLLQKNRDLTAKVKSFYYYYYYSLNFWNSVSNMLFCSMALKMYIKAGSLKLHLLDSWLTECAAVGKKVGFCFF